MTRGMVFELSILNHSMKCWKSNWDADFILKYMNIILAFFVNVENFGHSVMCRVGFSEHKV